MAADVLKRQPLGDERRPLRMEARRAKTRRSRGLVHESRPPEGQAKTLRRRALEMASGNPDHESTGLTSISSSPSALRH